MLGRARDQAVGRFGLRPSPGGFATPAFGDGHRVISVAGARLVVEHASTTAAFVDIDGATLRQLAGVAGADLDAALAVGDATPPLGDPDEPLAADHDAALALGGWFDLGARILDEVLAGVDGASRVQLWPEHFDLGCDVPASDHDGDRSNLGASPGDAFEPRPYLYVGPWRPDRPGDGGYWNAPFGAVLREAELRAAAEPVAAGVAFVRRGLELLRR